MKYLGFILLLSLTACFYDSADTVANKSVSTIPPAINPLTKKNNPDDMTNTVQFYPNIPYQPTASKKD